MKKGGEEWHLIQNNALNSLDWYDTVVKKQTNAVRGISTFQMVKHMT